MERGRRIEAAHRTIPKGGTRTALALDAVTTVNKSASLASPGAIFDAAAKKRPTDWSANTVVSREAGTMANARPVSLTERGRDPIKATQEGIGRLIADDTQHFFPVSIKENDARRAEEVETL